MKFPRRNFLHLATGAAALPAVSLNDRDGTRRIGLRPRDALGQQFIVENVAGAGGTIGSIRAMRAKPDGYTIQVVPSLSPFTPTSPLSRMSISTQLAVRDMCWPTMRAARSVFPPGANASWSPSSLSLSWQGRTSHQKI